MHQRGGVDLLDDGPHRVVVRRDAAEEALQMGLVHKVLASERPEGWDHQLRFEPGLVLAYEWIEGLPGWAAPLVLGLWILKDAVMFPFVRKAYERSDDHPAAAQTSTLASPADAIR